MLADELCRLIECEHFARLSGYFGDRCYIFGRAISATEASLTDLPRPSIGSNGKNYVLMVQIKFNQECVTVFSRISNVTAFTRYSDWYNPLSVDFSDSDLLSSILQYVKQINSKCMRPSTDQT